MDVPPFDKIIHRLLENEPSVTRFMHRFLEEVAVEDDSGLLTELRSLSYQDECVRLSQQWLPAVFRESPPATGSIAGLWFGLFEPVFDGLRTTDFYLCGSKRFQIDGANDWACKPDYWPEDRYAESMILGSLHDLFDDYPRENQPWLSVAVCLAYVAVCVRGLFREIPAGLLTGRRTEIGVAAGWDSGDFLYLGWLRPAGFILRDADEAIAAIDRQAEEAERDFREEFGSNT